MRHLIIGIAAGVGLSLAGTATAQQPVTDYVMEQCDAVGAMAHDIMVFRQRGYPHEAVYEAYQRELGDDRTDGALLTITKGAWDVPRYAEPRDRRAAAEGYAQGVYEWCTEALMRVTF